MKDIIEEGDVEVYCRVSSMLQKNLRNRAEDAIAQAPEVYKIAVRDTVDHACEAMEAFKETEAKTLVAPHTWKQYVSSNKEAIDKSLKDLGALVGKTAPDAKEAVAHEPEKVFELTEKAVKSIEESAVFFHGAREALVEKDKSVKESMKRIQDIMVDLNELSQKEMPDEAKDAFAKMQKESMEMMEHFQSLYEATHQPKGKMVPGKVAELFDVASTSLKNIQDDLKVCSCMKKAAVREQASGVYGFVVSTASKVIGKGKDYMKALRTAKDKVYSKGKDISDKLQHLKPVLVMGMPDSRDMQMSKYLINANYLGPPSDTLAQTMVKAMMKDGLGKKEILDNLTRLGKTIKDATSDRKTLEMIDGKDNGR